MRTEWENRKIVGTFEKTVVEEVNMLVKKPFDFRKEKPKKDFLQLEIYKKLGLNFF